MGETGLAKKRLMIVTLIGLAAVLAFLAITGTSGGQATYEGSSRCADCHEDMVELWENTFHGIDFATEWMYHDEPTNKYTYGGGNETTGMTGSCTPCHVVGYGLTDIGGFDPALPWNDTYNAGDDGENLHLLRIGCENCHGPGSDHTSSKSADDIKKDEFAYATSCGGAGNENAECHGGYRQWGNETIPGFAESAHWVNEAPASAQSRVSCANCRATQGFIARIEGDAWEELPTDEDVIWKITCMACHDPHPEEGEENEFQLRLPVDEICEACHYTSSSFGTEEVHHPQAEMRAGAPGYGATQTTWMGEVTCPECHMFSERRVSQGHLMEMNPKACMECHSMYETVEAVEAAIEHVQHRTHTALEPAVEELAVIQALKAWATGNESAEGDLWTEELQTAYAEAHWDLTLIEADASGGFHNPVWAMDMIEAGVERIEHIKEAMHIGGVSGKVEMKNGKAVEAAAIKDGMGTTVATTDAEGAFFFWAPADSMVYTIWDAEGMLIGSSSMQATAQQNVTAATITIEKATGDGDGEDGEDEEMGTLTWVLLIVVIILVILLVVMATRGKK